MTNCDFIGRMKTRTNNLRRYRRAVGLKQGDLGSRLEPALQQTAVSCHERGTRVPDVYQALQYASVLGCSVEDLFDAEAEQAELSSA